MASNQEGRQAAVRVITGTALDYNGDWLALFDHDSIPAGDFNGRFLAWINARLVASHASLPTAMNAYAAAHGFMNWDSINTIGATG